MKTQAPSSRVAKEGSTVTERFHECRLQFKHKGLQDRILQMSLFNKGPIGAKAKRPGLEDSETELETAFERLSLDGRVHHYITQPEVLSHTEVCACCLPSIPAPTIQ